MALLAARIDLFRLEVHDTDDSATVYLFVGADSGIDRDPNDPQYEAGTRADILMLVRLDPDGRISALSLPRDAIATGQGSPVRITLTRQQGPQELADAVCASTGISVDRYVEVDAVGFATAIDALGGIEVEIDYPVRDPAAELDISEIGAQKVDGATALALVRSRHPEELIDGRWHKAGGQEGAQNRIQWSSVVLERVRDGLAEADLPTLWNVAWETSESMTLGGGVHPLELRSLSRASFEAETIDTESLSDGLSVAITPAGRDMIEEAGFIADCSLEQDEEDEQEAPHPPEPPHRPDDDHGRLH